MVTQTTDLRSEELRLRDEALANESPLAKPDLPDIVPQPMEALLRRSRPVAIEGIVENGLIRPLDPAARLPERTKVIIVAKEAA